MMDLERALEQFDTTEANLLRLQAVWSEMQGLIPSGITFLDGTPEGRRYLELARAFNEIASALPRIAGYAIESRPLGLNEIAQGRFDIAEIGEFAAEMSFEEAVDGPTAAIDEYRFRFDQTRRRLVRDNIAQVADRVGAALADLVHRFPSTVGRLDDPKLIALSDDFQQLERLAGAQIPRGKPWGDLQRHLRFREGQDIHDIARTDWPAVWTELQRNLYSDLEPLPITVADLGDLADESPAGTVSVALEWARLSDEDFERLMFNLLSASEDYENAKWLTHTSAPDRGRDLSADHIRNDTLSGPTRERVLIQARHWLKRSVGMPEITTLVEQMRLWEPPPVNVLIVATSGRFATDAVDWIEKRNNSGDRPRIEMWANSHLEMLLARRPHLIAALGLRGPQT